MIHQFQAKVPAKFPPVSKQGRVNPLNTLTEKTCNPLLEQQGQRIVRAK